MQSPAIQALRALLDEQDHRAYQGWVGCQRHAAERAILLEAIERVEDAEKGDLTLRKGLQLLAGVAVTPSMLDGMPDHVASSND